MSGDSRLRRTHLDVRNESGAVLVFVTLLLATLLAMCALVIDVGHAFWAKRKLQSSADAAALAGAYDLPNGGAAAMAAALEYSGSAGRRNHEIGGTQTHICIIGYAATSLCSPRPNKVIVVERATIPTIFAGIIGVGSVDIKARAVASRGSTTSGTPRAIHVHELCPGLNGLLVNGLNATIEGGIHVNGKFKIAGASFESIGPATVYRPTAGSPSGPAQGTCNGPANLFIEDELDSTYCTGCGGTPLTDPAPGPYIGTWATPYHTEAIMKAATPCTDTTTTTLENVNVATPTVYCPSGKFEIKGNVEGAITVIGPEIVLNATGRLRPADATHPVLFYSTSSTNITVNPSGFLDWVGYIINRFGGIEINSGGVTSPREGLLEAQWILVNGENFTMKGLFADSSSGSISGAPSLDE